MTRRTTKAVAYIRVSTVGQAEEGVSMQAQEQRARAYVEANGLELVAVRHDELSGKRAGNRPGLQAAINDACEHQAALVVFSLSRLARSTIDCINIATTLEKCGADLVSLSEAIDTTSAAGRMFFRILATLAEFERDTISERTRAGLDYKRQRGERVSYVPRFGHKFADATMTKVVRCPNEQRHLKRILRQREQGWSLQRIADDMQRRRVRTKRGASKWHAKVIGDILKREGMR